jgi:hypothetical protein
MVIMLKFEKNAIRRMKTIQFFLLLIVSTLSYSQKPFNKDSLVVKRKALTTYIFEGGDLLTNKQVLSLYRDGYQSMTKFRWGNRLKPFGVPVAAGGVVLAVISLKGENKIAVSAGKEYSYVVRSLPKLLIGLGLFVGGGCILESSNELIANSAKIYNQNLLSKKPKKVSYFGLTNDGLSIGMRW